MRRLKLDETLHYLGLRAAAASKCYHLYLLFLLLLRFQRFLKAELVSSFQSRRSDHLKDHRLLCGSFACVDEMRAQSHQRAGLRYRNCRRLLVL